MRIAAGVLLILMSLGNGCIGIGLSFVGGVGTAVTQDAEVQEALIEQQATATEQGNAEAAEALGEVAEDLGLMLIYGIYLLVLFGMQIAGGVCLFISKAGKFIIAVGVMGLIAAGLALAAGADFGLPVILNLAVSVLAIVAALGIGKEGTGEAAPAPPAA